MALAQRLNELAVANSEGLLNDDEYRLLRQNVFEQYSSNVMIPVEVSIVPITRQHVQARATTPSTNHRRPTAKLLPPLPSQHKPPPSPVRVKPTVSSGVANLLRRATGRKPSTTVHDTPTTKDTRKGSGVNPPANDTPKRGVLIPRLLHRKPADLTPLRTDASRAAPDTSHPTRQPNTRSDSYRSDSPLSPAGSARHLAPPHSPSLREKSIPTVYDVFDDDNLTTAKDIRDAIAITEDEVRRLVEAFNNLEGSTLRRLQKQKARRLPTTTPASVNVLLEGREWREHRLVLSPSSPLFDVKERHNLASVDGTGDGISIRSQSSNKTTLSQSKSISSLPKHPPAKHPPGSPLSPHFRTSVTLARKNSTSSMSSQGTSFTSAALLGANTSSSLFRSASHLGLRKLRERDNPGMVSRETLGMVDPNEDGDDAEIADIRRRREDLIARYTARLEFLRAKRKGAELHEKLLRK
ncbi:hypothetical protein B0H34DRAFT_678438 [Crassisporium funariophilum]|nr:hypothetical protein B0H34DRAFT_678438 [Crassisporium funariophilum]